MAYVTNLAHVFDEDDCLGEMSAPAMDFALYLASIVGWMTRFQVSDREETNVRCQRTSNGVQCFGVIFGSIDRTTETIGWECIVCGDSGSISGWRNGVIDRTEG